MRKTEGDKRTDNGYQKRNLLWKLVWEVVQGGRHVGARSSTRYVHSAPLAFFQTMLANVLSGKLTHLPANCLLPLCSPFFISATL